MLSSFFSNRSISHAFAYYIIKELFDVAVFGYSYTITRHRIFKNVVDNPDKHNIDGVRETRVSLVYSRMR